MTHLQSLLSYVRQLLFLLLKAEMDRHLSTLTLVWPDDMDVEGDGLLVPARRASRYRNSCPFHDDQSIPKRTKLYSRKVYEISLMFCLQHVNETPLVPKVPLILICLGVEVLGPFTMTLGG